MKEINILFLGGAKRVSLAEKFIRTGELLNYKVNIFSYELTKQVPISIIGEPLIGLRWSDKNIYNHLKDVIKRYNINILLPFVDPAITICSRLKEQLPELMIPVSDIDICSVMFNKKYASEWLLQKSIPIPKIFNKNTIQYPAILKPITGSASKGIKVVEKPEEFNKVNELDSYIIQEYVADNQEYTVDCYISRKKEIISITPRIRLETAGGEVVNSITINEQRIIDISAKILKKGNFYGPITIQFIKDLKTDKIYVMEINPRLGGGVILSIEAGANIPEMILKEYNGETLSPYDWKENTLMTRYFKEAIFYADNS